MKAEKSILGDLALKFDMTQLDELIEKLKFAIKLIKELKDGLVDLDKYIKAIDDECFYTVDDVMEKTGYSKPTVLGMFNMKDFPACTVGRRKLVKKSAFWRMFDKPVVGDFEL